MGRTIKSAPVQWSAWGEWVWSKTHYRYYRQRCDDRGNVETFWGPIIEEEEGDDVPRQHIDNTTESFADSIAESFGRAQIDEGEEGRHSDDEQASEGEEDQDHEYRVASGTPRNEEAGSSRSRGKTRERERDKEKEKEKKSSKGKHKSGEKERTKHSKGKERREKGSRDDEKDRKGKGKETSDGFGSQSEEEEGLGERGYPGYGHSPFPEDPASGYQGYGAGSSRNEYPQDNFQGLYGPSSGLDALDDFNENEISQAIHESQRQTSGGGSTSAQYGDSTNTMSNHIASGAEYLEELDPRYRIEPSNKFQPGMVFKVLWPEPSGQTDSKTSMASERQGIRDNYGGMIYVGFRRFLVIGNDSGHCTCVPIFTYGNQGCKKKGVKPEKHGIVTLAGRRARLVSGEPTPGLPTVRMRMIAEGESIAWQSRANYSKLITVEHNVKVFFIGRVLEDDHQLVSDSVNKCWAEKTFYHRRR